MTMSRTGKQGPLASGWSAAGKHTPRIAQFITYFMVGNLATVVQLVLIPVLQPILGRHQPGECGPISVRPNR